MGDEIVTEVDIVEDIVDVFCWGVMIGTEILGGYVRGYLQAAAYNLLTVSILQSWGLIVARGVKIFFLTALDCLLKTSSGGKDGGVILPTWGVGVLVRAFLRNELAVRFSRLGSPEPPESECSGARTR